MTGYERFRRKALLTQAQLADRLHITTAAVCKWEVGGGTPKLSNLVKLSNLYGVPIEAIMRTDYPETDDGGTIDDKTVPDS